MKRSISMLLAILTLAGTLTLPSMAAEPDEEKGTAQEAVQEEESAQTDGTEAGEAEPEPEPDPEGTVTWGNLDDRIRAESLNARILIENITGIEDIDYDQMYEDLRRQLNDIAQAQWMMILMGAGQAADALDQSYDSLRDVFDSIKDGELQADNADQTLHPRVQFRNGTDFLFLLASRHLLQQIFYQFRQIGPFRTCVVGCLLQYVAIDAQCHILVHSVSPFVPSFVCIRGKNKASILTLRVPSQQPRAKSSCSAAN